MTLRILPLPVTPSPFTSLIQGAEVGQRLRGNYFKNKLTQDQAAYLPTALKNAASLAQAKLRGINIQNEYAPQLLGQKLNMLRQQAQEMSPLYQAKLALLNAQGKGAGLKNQFLEQALHPSIRPAVGNFSIGQNGAQLGGIPKLKAGGLAIGNGKAPLESGGLIASLGSPRSTYSSQGTTYIDPQTRTSINVPTEKIADQLQNQIIGNKNLQAFVSQIASQISPELGGVGGMGKRSAGAVARALGFNTPAYNQYLAATSAGTIGSVDQMLQAAGFNKNHALFQSQAAALKPDMLDTRQSYLRRVSEILAQSQLRADNAATFMNGGIPLQFGKDGYPTLNALSNQIYNNLLKGKGSLGSSTRPSFDVEKWINSAESSQDAKQKFSALTPAQQNTVRIYLMQKEGK